MRKDLPSTAVEVGLSEDDPRNARVLALAEKLFVGLYVAAYMSAEVEADPERLAQDCHAAAFQFHRVIE